MHYQHLFHSGVPEKRSRVVVIDDSSEDEADRVDPLIIYTPGRRDWSLLTDTQSLPLWPWTNNSCAYDAVFISLVVGFTWLGDVAHANTDVSTLIIKLHRATLVTWMREDSETLQMIRDIFRQTMYPMLGIADTDGMKCMASAGSLILRVINTLNPANRVVTISPSTLYLLQSFAAYFASGPNAVTSNTSFVVVELQTHDQQGDQLSNIVDYEQLEIPPSFSVGDQDNFTLVGCIDTNGSHFRAHVLINDTNTFQIGNAKLEPGIYLIDPYDKKQPVRKSGGDSLSLQVLNFTNQEYVPHLFLYCRVK